MSDSRSQPKDTKPSVAPHVTLTPYQISQRNTTTSPLLRLPAELRNQIFALALTHSQIPIYWCKSTWKFKTAKPAGLSLLYLWAPLNLLYVCRQIYAEIALLPYALNRFFIESRYDENVRQFLELRTLAQIDVMVDVRSRRRGWGSPMSAEEWMADEEEENDVLEGLTGWF